MNGPTDIFGEDGTGQARACYICNRPFGAGCVFARVTVDWIKVRVSRTRERELVIDRVGKPFSCCAQCAERGLQDVSEEARAPRLPLTPRKPNV